MHLTYNPISQDFIRSHNGKITRHWLDLSQPDTVELALEALALLRSLKVPAPAGASRPSPLAKPRDDLQAAIAAHRAAGGHITTSTHDPVAKRKPTSRKAFPTLAELGLE